MPSYHITEPHPSVPATGSYFHSGRGGAGNLTRVSAKNVTPGPTATGPASLAKLPAPPSNGYFLSGRGGAGNLHREKERAMFSFDEELAAQERLREHAAPVYHIGRGGAGNAVDEKYPRTSRTNSASSTMSSESERQGVRQSIEGAWHRMSKQFTH